MNDRIRLTAFCLFHGALLTGAVVWVQARAATLEQEKTVGLPVPRNVPLEVRPLRDDPDVVSDEQLRSVLDKLRPRFRGTRPRINHVDHALRFWGLPARFDDLECLSGLEMRDLLVDHRRFRSAWGEDERPLLERTADGVRVRVQSGPASSSHVDHTLATLAEVGTPIDYPVLLENGETTVRELFEYSRRNFSLNQQEYEWSTLAFALYAPTDRSWNTTEGQRIDFGKLVERIVRQQPTQGVCYGNHRLHTLVMLLRIDDQVPILDESSRSFLVDHLRETTAHLVRTQSAEGYWDADWDGSDRLAGGSTRLPLARRILVTGHVLEWCALAPDEVLPPRDVLVRAAQWLVAEIEALSPGETRSYYTYLSHAGRALALWRGRFPYEVSLGDE